ncbi:MAG: hypothetical protein LBE07_04955 [Gordonia sp. (in: high G+C Gram-positive bacteria)]|jgi:hypothetical protein|nr:hypothetical protein [Gordonia sp. (in: high G+C Gram-positive bacteria)]
MNSTSAVIGVPVAGVVQLWTDAPSIWQVDDFDGFASLVGTGQIARTEIAPRRFREVGLLDEEAGTLTVGDATFTLTPAEAFDGDFWDSLNASVTRIAADAFGRAEIVVTERGGWETSDAEYCLAGALINDGQPIVLIETAPTPTDNDFWPPSDDPVGQTVTAPLSDESLPGVGVLTMAAVNSWGVAPWDVAVTYLVPDRDTADETD